MGNDGIVVLLLISAVGCGCKGKRNLIFLIKDCEAHEFKKELSAQINNLQ